MPLNIVEIFHNLDKLIPGPKIDKIKSTGKKRKIPLQTKEGNISVLCPPGPMWSVSHETQNLPRKGGGAGWKPRKAPATHNSAGHHASKRKKEEKEEKGKNIS